MKPYLFNPHCAIYVQHQRLMWLSKLRNLRCITIVSGVANSILVVVGGILILETLRTCDSEYVVPFVVVSLVACVRIGVMIQTGIAQESTARTILESPSESATAVTRLERRIRYKKWLWWNRFTVVVIVLQFVCAAYLILKTAAYYSSGRTSSDCILGSDSGGWKPKLLASFMIMVCFVVLVQCFGGSDVFRWRSFYDTHDNAWKSHYSEVFDNGIREALCCLGRAKYMSASDEDEVYSVARLLGDLVAYRASGTGHIELLAGLALLENHRNSTESFEDCLEAPDIVITEAAALHTFAEAAYTGPLLDLGRSPFIFACVWLYRQGLLSPWTRSRWPVLHGDNWWRGHAAAFLKYVNLPPEVLRQGRVNQSKCEAAYFVVVLHHLQSVVISIRGTETPEDLITDGLCKSCTLSVEDLAGLINCSHVEYDLKKKVASTFPHFGHSGIVEAAREIFMQIEGNPREHESESWGLLPSLLGTGCECFGYNVRVVGHSLGGAIAALLGLKLYHRYPNLHVYAFGPLPCVDSVVAEACTEFVTSIVFGNEFSTRLSIASVLRLRAAAIASLSQYPKADAATILKLARRFLYLNKFQNKTEANNSKENLNHPQIYRSQSGNGIQGIQELSPWAEAEKRDCVARPDNKDYINPFANEGSIEHEESLFWTGSGNREHVVEINNAEFSNPFATTVNSNDDPVSQFIDTLPNSENGSFSDPPEMYLPGLVIHITPEQKDFETALWTPWRIQERGICYKAYIANRENFRDIIVSLSMFLDHFPWRCHVALQKLLKARTA